MEDVNIYNRSLEQIITVIAEQAAIKAVELLEEKTKSKQTAELWNKTQVIEYLRVSYNTLEKFIEKGVIKPVRIGKTMRFDADELKTQVHEIREHLYER